LCYHQYFVSQRKENVSKTDSSTWPFVTYSQSTALGKNAPFSTLKTHSHNEHHIGKNDIASGTSDETHSKSNKVKCCDNINILLNTIVEIHH
jgi:hypothetical protein